MHVPMFDGQAFSYANYEEKIMLRYHISIKEPQKRAANLLLHMSDVGRKVCITVGQDVTGDVDGVAQISRILRNRFAPDAIDRIPPDMAKSLYFGRTDQNLETYLMEFDMLRQKAEARTPIGSRFPDEFVSVSCVQNTALTKNGKTSGLASSRNTLAFPEVSAQMRRLSGPRGYASRQDVLVAAERDAASEEENFEAWERRRG